MNNPAKGGKKGETRMARKRIVDGGRANRPREIIEEEKFLSSLRRQWRAENNLGKRGRLPKGIQCPSEDELVKIYYTA